MQTMATAPPEVQEGRARISQKVQYAAAGLSALTAAIYFLIGFRVVTVLDDPSDQTIFGLVSGLAFLVGAVVLAYSRKRVMFVIGAIGVGLVVFTYFDLAPDRSPQYEPWGITIRVVQTLMILALGYLAVRPPRVQVE